MLKKEKIKKWLKDNQNKTFVGIILFAFAIRIYYLISTGFQPLWWDETEYMNVAKHIAFGMDYYFEPVKQVLFPLISAFFLKIFNSELLPRLFIFLVSMASVFGVYYLGKEIYNKKVGLLSSFLMSIFYLNLFFTYRLLVDLISMTFFVFSALFFYKYFKTNSNKMLYTAMIITGVGTLFRLTTGIILLAILIYLLITEKFEFIKKKEWWISALIFVLILAPYIIWGFFEFHGFVITQASATNAPDNYISSGINVLSNYLKLFPTYFSIPLLIIFIAGLISMYNLILCFDILLKKKKTPLRKDFYSLLLFLVPLILMSLLIGHNEDRYILTVFPAVFIISSLFIFKAYNFIKKKSRFIAVLLLLTFLIFITVFQLQSANSLIVSKQTSYEQVKQAGLWLKENANGSDIVATASKPQIRYYSELQTVGFPETKEEFQIFVQENSPDYFILSVFESNAEWAYTYPQEENLKPVQIYYDSSKNPLIVIYSFN